MNTNEELRQQMWELAYGLLSPEEVASLHAHIKSDPAAARLYAEVRLQADLVADAAKVSDPTVQFEPQGKPVIIRPMPAERTAASGAKTTKASAKGVNWLVGLAGTALAALLCLVLFRPTASDEQLAARFVVTTVETPARLQAGMSQEVSVYTSDIDQVGKSAEVEVRLVDSAGKERLRRSVRTEQDGHARVELPGEALEPGVRLEVAAAAGRKQAGESKEATADLPVTVQADVVPEPVETFVLLDKPAYAPGETVNFATCNVTRFSKQVVSDPGHAMRGAKWKADEKLKSRLELEGIGEGIVTGKFQLPADHEAAEMASGRQSLAKSMAGDEFRADLYYFNQLTDDLPELAKAAEKPDQPAADMRFGSAGLGPRELSRSRIGASLGAASPGQSEAGAAPPPEPPAPSAAATDFADSLAPEATPGEIAPDRSDVAVVAAGEGIEVSLPTGGSDQFLVTLKCADRVVASQRFSLPEAKKRKQQPADDNEAAKEAESLDRSIVSLQPAPEADGEMLVSIYDDSQHPPQLIEQRRLYREPRQRLQIAIEDLKPHYALGEKVRLDVQVVDEKNQPVDATLAVRVWNERLVQAAGAPVADLASTLQNGSEELGTQSGQMPLAALAFGGFRRFDSRERGVDRLSDDAATEDPASQTSQSFALEGNLDAAQVAQQESLLGDGVLAPVETSNLAEVKAAYASLLAERRHDAMERRTTIGRLLLIGGVAVLVLLGMQTLLRASAKTSVWLPTIVLAAASLVIGTVWLNPNFQTHEVMETAAVPEETRSTKSSGSAPAAGAAPEGAPTDNGFEALDASKKEAAEKQLANGAKFAETAGQKDAPPLLMREGEEDSVGKKKEDVPRAEPSAAPPENAPAPSAAAATVPTPAPPNATAPLSAPALAESEQGSQELSPAKGPQSLGGMRRAKSMSRDSNRDLRELRGNAEQPGGMAGGAAPAGGGQSSSSRQNEFRQPDKASRPAPTRPAEGSVPAGPSDGAAGSNGPPPLAARLMNQAADKSGQPGELEDRPTADQPAADAQAAPFAAGKALSDEGDANRQAGIGMANKNQGNLTQGRGMLPGNRNADPSAQATAPAALLFQPVLVTDSRGKAVVEFTLPDVDCEYRVLIDAIGHGRVGSLQQVIVGRSADGTADE